MNHFLCPRCRECSFVDSSFISSPQIAVDEDGDITLTGKDDGSEVYICMHCRIYWTVPPIEKVDYEVEFERTISGK